MFGIGGQELVLLMLIGLVVLGPERLPRIASQLGGWLGLARRMTRMMNRPRVCARVRWIRNGVQEDFWEPVRAS